MKLRNRNRLQHNRYAAIALFFLAVTLSVAQNVGDYPLQSSSPFPDSDAGEYQCLSIVESVRTIGFENRTPPELLPKPKVDRPLTTEHFDWVEEVRVIDSLTLPKGAIVRVVVQIGGKSIKFPFAPGKRYLVIATGQKNGRFLRSSSYEKTGVLGEIAKSPNEIEGYAEFETQKAKLSNGDSPPWRIANCIADSLEGS